MSYQIDGIVTVVEYDGDEHYRHSMKIKGDRAKKTKPHGFRDAGSFASHTGYS